MKLFSKVAAAAVVTAIAVGGGATVASAYSISGGSYTGVPGMDQAFTIGGSYSYECPAVSTTFPGTATGADATTFTPSYGSCSFFGFPLTVTQSGSWNLKVIGGPVGGYYSGELQIPAGTSTTVDFPIGGCTIVVAGAQSFSHGVNGTVIRMRNTGSGVELEASVYDIVYTATGCPHGSGSDGTYFTNGPITIPGITVS